VPPVRAVQHQRRTDGEFAAIAAVEGAL